MRGPVTALPRGPDFHSVALLPGQELNRSRNEHRIISESAYLQEIFCVPFVS